MSLWHFWTMNKINNLSQKQNFWNSCQLYQWIFIMLKTIQPLRSSPENILNEIQKRNTRYRILLINSSQHLTNKLNWIKSRRSHLSSHSSRAEMRFLNLLFVFRMVYSSNIGSFDFQKRMVPMFESTVPVTSLVSGYNHGYTFQRTKIRYIFSSIWSMSTPRTNWLQWLNFFRVNLTPKKSWLWLTYFENGWNEIVFDE